MVAVISAMYRRIKYMSMKNIAFKSLLSGALGLLVALVFALQASAMTPSLSINSNGYTMQVTVYGDANSPIILDYYANGQVYGAGIIGYTNYSGSFSGSINQSNYYSIPNGAQVYVVVNGQQSATTVWQNYGYNNNNQYPYNNGTVSFSVSNVNLSVGQSQTVYINGTYNTGYNNQYYLSSNLSSGVVTASLNGSALTLYGQNNGSATITVCSSSNGYYNNSGCGTLYVTVSGSNYYNQCPTYNYYNNYNCSGYPYNNYNNGISVSNSNVQVSVGSTATVAIYAGYNNNYYNQYNYNTNYYVTNNNGNIVSTSISGSTLSIYGLTPGTTSLNVCQNGGGCTNINVTVNQYYYTNNGYYNGYNQYPPYPYNNGQYYWNQTGNCWTHY